MNLNEHIESIPNAKVGQIVELMEKLAILGGHCDREGLAYALGVKENTVYTPIRAASILGFVTIDSGIKVTDVGNSFIQADEPERCRIFGSQLVKIEPFATIVRALEHTSLSEAEIVNYIKAKTPAARKWKDSTTKELFKTIRGWCIYGDIFTQGAESGMYMRS